MEQKVREQYQDILNKYLQKTAENHLYEGQQLSKSMMEQGVSPEEIVGFHIEVLKKSLPNLPPDLLNAFNFLLEVMIGYGLQYREHQSLREKQIQLQSELDIAAEMQQTLLSTVPKDIPGIELGVLSKAAKKMSGDYYHLFMDSNDYLGIAVADIIGKGIPAALCMSMIKYAIESLTDQPLDPNALLGSINRVVENNIDPNMFITMIYGSYNFKTHHFRYATAGHEPGLFYCAQKDAFYDLEIKGPVLGLSCDSMYIDFTKQVNPGDMIILFSDGVTESKKDGEFIDREGLITLLHQYKDLPAQSMAEAVHEEILKWSDFELNDDQTIVVLKRNVLTS
jgi:sigma-B regulation protein RsbU (phosphoserine phosphatase)